MRTLWKRSHVVLNSLITYTTPIGNTTKAPVLGTPRYKGNISPKWYRGTPRSALVTLLSM